MAALDLTTGTTFDQDHDHKDEKMAIDNDHNFYICLSKFEKTDNNQTLLPANWQHTNN